MGTGAIDQTIELNEAAKKLNAPKRRIYDVTNVLEGIGLVTKKAKNHFEWVGGDVDSNGQVEPDELELQRFFGITRVSAEIFLISLNIPEHFCLGFVNGRKNYHK